VAETTEARVPERPSWPGASGRRGDDVGVMQRDGSARLTIEASDAIRIAARFGGRTLMATSRFRREFL